MNAVKNKLYSSRLITLIVFIVYVVVWGYFPIVVKIGTQHTPPLLFAGTRFLLASGVLAVVVWIGRGKLRLTSEQHWRIFLSALVLVGIPASIYFLAAPYVQASVIILMWAPTPIFTTLFMMGSASGEARGWRLIVSLVAGLAGVFIVLMGGIPFLPGMGNDTFHFASGGITLLSELAVLGSSVIYGLGMRLTKSINSSNIPLLTFTTWQLFYSGVSMTVLSLIVEHNFSIQLSWVTLWSFLFIVLIVTCMGYFLTFWLMRRIGAIRTAYVDFLSPGVTIVLSYFLLNESLTPAKVAGFLLVVLGCMLASISR
ncbi:MAG TPA: DMT family transporter [Ktedonobacteraceae bacterium]|jgi:drug/metabolite transporter (DMT)-like permease|nr:DMT family transporter [Ktedonobacteraceae bacterium]